MKVSRVVAVGFVVVAGSAVRAAPARQEEVLRLQHSAEGLRDAATATTRLSAQRPIVQHHPGVWTEPAPHRGNDAAAAEPASSATEPWDDFVETIVDEEEEEKARRQELDDRVLDVKSSRVRMLLLDDPAVKVRYEDLPDRPIDDPTRWRAARGLGTS